MSERYGLNAGEQAELAEYTVNRFGDCTEIGESDNGFLKTWESIISRSLMTGAADAINERCVRHVRWSSARRRASG